MSYLSNAHRDILQTMVKYFGDHKDQERGARILKRIVAESESGKISGEYVMSMFDQLGSARDRITILHQCETKEAKTLLNNRF